jgi:hypothetical protein
MAKIIFSNFICTSPCCRNTKAHKCWKGQTNGCTCVQYKQSISTGAPNSSTGTPNSASNSSIGILVRESVHTGAPKKRRHVLEPHKAPARTKGSICEGLRSGLQAPERIPLAPSTVAPPTQRPCPFSRCWGGSPRADTWRKLRATLMVTR